jgi:CheY-like chemotaxis protein
VSRRTVLIVDDDQDFRGTLSEVLGAAGYRTLEAGDGAQALVHLEADGAIGLILLDLMMPGINGWELHRQLLQHEHWSTIPLVVLTAGEGGLGDIPRLSKLVELAELLRTVDEYCR